MNKVIASAEAAVADIHDGATVGIGGFGPQHCWPVGLVKALGAKGCKNLCGVATAVGGPGEYSIQHLIEKRQVRKVIASFSIKVGAKTAAEEQILAGELEAELVPQGIVAERCRAGGAGIPAFYSPSGAGTAIADGKDVRYFDGRPYVLEHAIKLDFALIRGLRADRAGNVQFRGNTRNFNVSFAKSARITIVEVDEVVDTGQIPPDRVDLPGIFVTRVVQGTQASAKIIPKNSYRRAADTARSYNGKPGLTRLGIAKRASRLIREGSYVNLGSGIPEQVSNFFKGRDVLLHAENGMLGYGEMVTGDDIDPNVYSAGGQFVSVVPGACFFDSVTSFEMARGGHVDAVVLGAYEVDEQANIANWSTANPLIPNLGGIGGAMDLVAGGSELIVVMEHCDSKGNRKLRRRCSLPLTGLSCVNWIVTDLALLHWTDGRFVLEEVAPGFTADEVVALTEMSVTVSPNLRTMD